MEEKGGISVQTQHIFPIIKRWLYSEKDIFLREIVSNASDAITKYRHLVAIGQAKDDDRPSEIKVIIDKDKKTLTVTDNGIGMTVDEIKKYINQIALSGALDFVEKYDSGKGDDGIIGHFGLGFYSSFMVADRVCIRTRSYTDAPAVLWDCSEDGEFSMTDCDKTDRGTEVVMYINDDEQEYLSKEKIAAVLEEYCSFMPYSIYLQVVGEKPEEKKEKDENGNEVTVVREPEPINDTVPLWTKNPSECTDEEYNEFYRKVFKDFREPLFHVHINADYPLNFKGIFYFPRLNSNYDNFDGQIKLYYNRVFVADNIKEVVPDFLLMLRGVLDCPELPLNVSRSYLQNSEYVKKISAHIVKKISDKLNSLFNTDREKYEKFWDDIKPFIEYACIRDGKFYERTKDAILFRTVEKTHVTLKEYLEKSGRKTVYYTTDPEQQAIYVNMLKAQGISVLVLDNIVDTQFISKLEQSESEVKFLRADAGVDDIKSGGDAAKNETLEKLFREVSSNGELKVELVELKDENTPAVLTLSEESRRFADMMKMYAVVNGDGTLPDMTKDASLVLNTANELVKKLEQRDPGDETTKALAKQVYILALLGQRKLTADELSAFISESCKLLGKIN